MALALGVPAAANAAPGDPAGVARVATVFPLTTPETRTALISAEALAGYTSPTGALTRDLDAVIDTSAAIAIDPMILASIRVLGTSAPQSALDWLSRLSQAPNETFSLTYADTDVTVGLQAGASSVIAPNSFDFAIDPTLFATPPAETPTATPDPEPTEPPRGTAPSLPTAQSLLSWDYTVPAIVWPVADTVITSDLATMVSSGFNTTIVNSGNIERTDRSKAMASLGSLSAVTTDDGLSQLFGDAIDAETMQQWESAVALLQPAVDASAAEGDAGGAAIVLAVDRTSLGTASRLRSTLAAIDALPSSDLASFSSVLDSARGDATITDRPQSPERVRAAQTLLTTEASDAAFASVAENPELITGERRLRMLATMSNAWYSYPGGWGSALALFESESVALHDSVRVVQSSPITLIADRGSLYITVTNELNQPVNVNIDVTAPTPLLAIEQSPVPLTIEPESQKRAAVPAQSLSNGTAVISISISSPTGDRIGTPTTVSISVYAGWETPITVALGVFVVGVFGFGIARLVVRRSRARRERAAGNAPVDESE
ncbi:hypothetical protein GCM10027413_02390 [Conyzicola nivalis]|uniref:Uncharacterized protein n=1 Tax=Conyzicola nivalis TaxID=1477021 RepID=A0A916SN82_9MICO|nr:hypothetical protein GCM10010979_24250 [Conyzicola nivalis]